jgi:Tol biopolymer transport system component
MTHVVPSEPQPELAPGTRVGHYEIVGELGRGGLGVVYRARDSALGRDVALKSPLPDHASHEDRRRFLTEARAVARLSHPAILPIFEAFEDGDRPWLAMALAEGRPLRAELDARGALPLEGALSHAESLAEALDAAHAKHVLHRDVTPGNIILTPEGRVVLMDFGLAQFFVPPDEASRAATGDGSDGSGVGIAGTPGYMSPEQWLARPLDVTTDIFGLGAVLYEMITGRRAFPGYSSGEILDATLHRDPPPLTRFTHAVPADLDRIVHKALAKRPDERYATAKDLLVDLRTLRRHLEGKEEHAERTPSGGAFRRLLWPGVGASALVALTWALWQPGDVPAAVPQQVTAGPGWEADPALAPDGSLVAYVAEEAGRTDLWVVDTRGGDPLRLTNDPAIERDPTWYADGSGVAYASDHGEGPSVWRVPRLGGAPVLLLPDAEDPAISPDGTRIAFARVGPKSDRRVFVAPLADLGAARMITGDDEGVWDHAQPAWSPDGTRISYSAQRDLWVVPAAGGGARRLTADGEYDRESAWSPDGRYVYFSSFREGTLALWRVSSQGGRPVRITMGTGPESHPSVPHDGTRLAYSTLLDTADVVVRDLATGAERRFGDLRDDDSPALAPDRRAVVFVSDRADGRTSLWVQPLSADGQATGAPRRLTEHRGTASHPSVSPDGRLVAYHRVLDGQRDIWVVPLSGGTPLRVTDDPAIDVHPSWSPDGRSLVFVSGRSGSQQVWVQGMENGRPAGPPRQLTDTKLSVQAPTWSPDGTRVALVAWDDRGSSDLWIVPAGGGPLRRVTNGARAWRARWDWQALDALFVSGFWTENRASVRRVAADGSTDSPEVVVWLGTAEDRTIFDVSRDGRLLAFGRQDPRGDVWVLSARRGKY